MTDPRRHLPSASARAKVDQVTGHLERMAEIMRRMITLELGLIRISWQVRALIGNHSGKEDWEDLYNQFYCKQWDEDEPESLADDFLKYAKKAALLAIKRRTRPIELSEDERHAIEECEEELALALGEIHD